MPKPSLTYDGFKRAPIHSLRCDHEKIEDVWAYEEPRGLFVLAQTSFYGPVIEIIIPRQTILAYADRLRRKRA